MVFLVALESRTHGNFCDDVLEMTVFTFLTLLPCFVFLITSWTGMGYLGLHLRDSLFRC